MENACFYQTKEAIEAKINLGIKKVWESFNISIEATYINDGCSGAESLNNAIQQYVSYYVTLSYSDQLLLIPEVRVLK